MGIQVRDERQMKALTGLSPAQFDDLLAVFGTTSIGSRSRNVMKKGVSQGLAGENHAVVPQANGPPSLTNCCGFFIPTRRIPPVMSSEPSVRWRGRKPMKTRAWRSWG